MKTGQLLERPYWIFDMDGTLTQAIHDFDAIRAELGLPAGKPILEQLAKLPDAQARLLNAKLDHIELAIAQESRAAPGAAELLDYLTARDYRLGILTRNNRVNIDATLKAAGLAQYFTGHTLISRDCAPAKPNPAGIHLLLEHWDGRADHAVMLGDHLFDLDTGRAAGTATVHVDSSGLFPHRKQADVCVQALNELLDSTH